MNPVRTITGTAVPIRRADIDTDQIIPAVWLKRVERTGFGQGLFSAWRENDPNFVLDRPEYAGATILVAGPNFGIGSSREHAVWSLMDHGFRAVVSPRFGDIFRVNSTKSGLVPVVLPEAVVERLWDGIERDPATPITIDVESTRLLAPALGIDEPFPLDPFTRHRLLEGLDDIGLSLRHANALTTFEANRPSYLPRIEVAS